MAERSNEFMLNTLKGKIWLAVVTLAVINCLVGLAAFFSASFVFTNTLVPALLAVLAPAAATVIFAWWMSNVVMGPIEKVNLLAKSIERSPGMTLPKTTGAAETDEILFTLGRASQQLVNFIDLMDDVTAGRTDAALNPLENSDRISASFQKLVAKVTDSIDAKKELDELQFAVNQISGEVAGLQRGDLIHVRNEFAGTRSISDALRFLIHGQSELTRGIHINTAELKNLTSDGRKRIRAAIEKDEARKRKFKTLTAAVTDAHNQADRSAREVSVALSPVADLLDRITRNTVSPADTSKSLAAVRKRFDGALHKLRSVGEQSLAITHASKSVQDLARRSSMLALNTSIQADSTETHGFAALTQEITSLSERAEKANKAISGISDSVTRDVNDAQASLRWLVSEVAKISDQTVKDDEASAEITSVLSQLAQLPERIDLKLAERSAELERMLQILEDCSARSDEVSAELQACEANYLRLLEPLENLGASVTGRKQTPPPVNGNGNKPAPVESVPAIGEPVRTSDMLELLGEN